MTEDVAVLLADFVSSLDNLPSEVHHILQEIGHKEGRASDFRTRAIARDQSIQKHSRPPNLNGQGLLVPNPKEETQITKIRADLEKAEASAREKVALSERGCTLLARHLGRLTSQLEVITPANVPPLPTLPTFAPVVAPPVHQFQQQQYASAGAASAAAQFAGSYAAQNAYNASQGYTSYGTPLGADKRKAASAVGTPPIQVPLLPAQLASSHQSYQYTPTSSASTAAAAARAARPSRMSGSFPGVGMNGLVPSPGMGVPGGPGTPGQSVPSPQHQQFLAAQSQHHQAQLQQMRQQQAAQAQVQAAQQHQAQQAAQAAQAAAAAQAAYGSGGGGGGGGGSGGGGNKRKRAEEQEEKEEDAEGEVEGDDLTPYCTCQRPSFGEMIGCDSSKCAIEWFHLSCVGLKNTPEGSWYCEDCTEKMKSGGGGRKKARN